MFCNQLLEHNDENHIYECDFVSDNSKNTVSLDYNFQNVVLIHCKVTIRFPPFFQGCRQRTCCLFKYSHKNLSSIHLKSRRGA